MNPFENVPDELLYEMCEGWSNEELANMTQAYDRAYQICHKILEKRQENIIIEEEAELQKLLNMINHNDYINFASTININGYKLLEIVGIIKSYNNIEIVQDISNPMLSQQNFDLFSTIVKQVPRIRLDSTIKDTFFKHTYNPYSDVRYYLRSYRIKIDDISSLKNLIRYIKGYKIIPPGQVTSTKYDLKSYQ